MTQLELKCSLVALLKWPGCFRPSPDVALAISKTIILWILSKYSSKSNIFSAVSDIYFRPLSHHEIWALCFNHGLKSYLEKRIFFKSQSDNFFNMSTSGELDRTIMWRLITILSGKMTETLAGDMINSGWRGFIWQKYFISNILFKLASLSTVDS